MTSLRERLWILFTNILHFALGVVATLSGLEIAMVLAYVFYQYFDAEACGVGYRECNEEAARDIAEFIAGLVVGALMKLFFA